MSKNITKPKHRTPIKQIRSLLSLSVRYWPYIFLILLTCLISFVNYEPGTFLAGWDNLLPELNPALNLKRAFFSVWQEYQSTGLLGGMAHASDLPRSLLIYLLSFLNFIPTSLYRYLSTYFYLIIGPLGVYTFLNQVFKKDQDARTTETASLLGSIFYILNLGTLQNFFTPFESFVAFYGVFPWLFLSFTYYLKKPSLKSLLFIFILSLFSTTAFYVETIFVVFSFCLLALFTDQLIHQKQKLVALGHIFVSSLVFFLANLFWLLPVGFFVLTNGHVGEFSKINKIASPETYYRNLEFGNFPDLLQLKGFWFKFLDLDTSNQKFSYLLNVWNNHLNSPVVNAISIIIPVLFLIGLYYTFKKKFPYSKSVLGIFFICLFFLLGGGLLINSAIPFVGELFRSPFTKFVVPFTFVYSYFFAVGAVFILDIFAYLDTKLTYNLTLFSVTLCLLIYMSPIFSGNLISKDMKLNIPDEYFQLFNFLNTQNSTERIASLPQNTFWGWSYYDWKYRGSGFLWYGIKQPILDRAFDVWEKTSENYYQEISNAIFSNDKDTFNETINKYGVTWVLLDKHLISADKDISLGTENLEIFLNDKNLYTLTKNFNDQIFLYRTTSSSTLQNFIKVETPKSTLPLLSFSPRPSFDWTEKANYLNTVTQTNPPSVLNIPSLSESEDMLPYKVEYRKYGSNLTVRFSPIIPTFFINQKQYDLSSNSQSVSIPVSSSAKEFIVNINSQYLPFELPSEVDDFNAYYLLTEIYLPTKKSFDFSIYSGIASDYFPLTNSLQSSSPKQCYTQKSNRKIEKILSPNSVTLLGTDVVGCLSTSLPDVSKDELLSIAFTYYSPTLTTANLNITNDKFGTQNNSQPLDPSNTPKRVRLFSKPSTANKQVNLILEAEGTKSIQEITYKDVFLTTHHPIFESSVVLSKIPSKKIDLEENSNIQISLPVTKTQFDLRQIASSNSLFPEDRNCDQFNKGQTVKIVNQDNIVYQSQNAIQCDYLNLRHLSHSLNYLIGFDVQNQKGLRLTTCLENHTTRRCDVYERLIDSQSVQYLLQPISNPDEANGYTLHLFNQSIGNRITSNTLNSLTVQAIPLKFLSNITTQSTDSRPKESLPNIATSHPAEFIYLASVKNITNQDHFISLYQTKSSYWKALIVPQEYLKLNSWQLTTKVILNYSKLPQLTPDNPENWYNSWSLKTHDDQKDLNLVFVYLPQYLEFLGLLVILPTSAILLTLVLISHNHKKRA